MLPSLRTQLVAALCSIVMTCLGQSHVMVKRLFPVKGYRNYQETHLIDVVNLGYEHELKRQLTIGGELFYSYYRPALPASYHRVNFGSDHFYDRSTGVGLFTRAYSGGDYLRVFVQAGLQLSFVHIKQPVFIPANYKDELRIINNKEWIPSGTIALGASFGDGRWHYEPYVQFGMGKLLSETRGNSALIAALGKQERGKLSSWLVVPFSVKWRLPDSK